MFWKKKSEDDYLKQYMLDRHIIDRNKIAKLEQVSGYSIDRLIYLYEHGWVLKSNNDCGNCMVLCNKAKMEQRRRDIELALIRSGK